MKTNVFRFLAFALSAVFLAAAPAAQAQQSDRDSVVDARQNPVRDMRGGCVRTKWTGANDYCKPKQEVIVPPPQVQEKVAQLTREERTVYFEFDKANITLEGMNRLDDLLVKLGTDKEVVRGNIVGYADEMGKDDYNRELSSRRAEAVKGYLIARGFKNIGVVEVRALGESASITNCDDKLARQARIDCLRQDRRVEVELQVME